MTTSAVPGVVIVGGGQAGVDLAFSLRFEQYAGPVTVISAEAELPYRKPPLSKDHLALGATETEYLRSGESYAEESITLRLGVRVTEIERTAHTVTLDDGTTVPYTHLVLALGAEARTLPMANIPADKVLSLRSLADARKVHALFETAADIAVVGGGFIGLEAAAAAAKRGIKVTVYEAAPRLMGRAVCETVSDFALTWHREHGVEIVFGADLSEIRADGAVVGIGVTPTTDIAEKAGLQTDDGIVVDETLRTSDPAIFAIGDCARFPTGFASGPVRLESIQNASDQARHVAHEIATGECSGYASVPWFWSDQGDLAIKMAGITSGHDETLVLGNVDSGSFSVLCFADGVLVGADSVNDGKTHMTMRRLLAKGVRVTLAEASAPGFDLKQALSA
ncbi:NAD(P)-binding protein [Nocardioides sp. zg-579]|uniref:NAD(P)-binding protein n=1 Tax=Nocardioides marmotae TaxID=2663857 RepID=A0A6I3J476_9ACTN|nr:FAD-dependent oxidoreductase [Nocardioides marmotae]MCR6030093.1 NAD(P)-binding protein [Gordonia jinghuaiqii]MTB93724.1 NAD(P)-binding protein [Nocardioides marmotae]QKE00068.1 FAD-dependent oxidoreductase [Nocardioides marmotae]